MPAYISHDLGIVAPWPLPPGTVSCPPDHVPQGLRVEEGSVSWSPDEAGPGEQYRFDRESNTHFFYWKILGKVEVRSGGRVTIEAASDAPRGILPHAITGPIVAHSILLSGGLPLHANCVRIGDRLIALVGASGAGKSSLAAALISLGALPHADDVAAVIPDRALVPFGTSRIKINPDVMDQVSLPVVSSQNVYEGLAKQSVELPRPEQLLPLPLSAVYRIVDTEGPDQIREVDKFDQVLLTMSEIYRPHVAEQAVGLRTLLERSGALVGRVRMFDLMRSRDLRTLPRLARSVAGHFQSLL